MIFDCRLTWEPHIRDLKATCNKRLDIFRALVHTDWGADRTVLLRLYTALIQPKLDYGCEIYSSATPARLRRLDAIHHAGVRLSTGAFRSTPIPSLLSDAKVAPLDLHRESLIRKCAFRLRCLPNSLSGECSRSTHLQQTFDIHPSLPRPFGIRATALVADLHLPTTSVAHIKTPKCPPWTAAPVSVCQFLGGNKADFLPNALCALFLAHTQVHEGSIHIYTDGSKSEEGVGYSVAFPEFTRSGTLPITSSIFTAELKALRLALEEIYVFNNDFNTFTIFTDSLSSQQALSDFNNNHPIVQDIFEWLVLLGHRGRRITFCWVPAHVGIPGNERADADTKVAASRGLAAACRLPYRDFLPCIKAATYTKWQERWQALDRNKMRQIALKVCPWQYSPMPRRWETAVVRLRTGHTRLTHGYLMSGAPLPYCLDCIVPLTVEHLLTECPSLRDFRDRHLAACREPDGSYSLSKILGQDSCSYGGCTYNFVLASGILPLL